MDDYDFARELDDQLMIPQFDPEKWASRKAWFDDMYELGYYWIEDSYDSNGEPKK